MMMMMMMEGQANGESSRQKMQAYFEQVSEAAPRQAITLKHFLMGCFYFPGELFVEDPSPKDSKLKCLK